jgi:DNA-binding CsgD family transcriptional regulator
MRDSPIDKLTERQKEVLRLYYARMDRKEIARKLGISPETVKQHLDDARTALGVSRSAEAARLLFESDGLLTPPSRGTPPWGMNPDAAFVPFPVVDPARSEAPAQSSVEERVAVYAPPDLPPLSRVPWPFPRRGRPHNDLTLPAILTWTVLGAIGIGAGALVVLAVLEALQDGFARFDDLLLRWL